MGGVISVLRIFSKRMDEKEDGIYKYLPSLLVRVLKYRHLNYIPFEVVESHEDFEMRRYPTANWLIDVRGTKSQAFFVDNLVSYFRRTYSPWIVPFVSCIKERSFTHRTQAMAYLPEGYPS